MILLEYMVPLQISDFGMTREVESEMYYKLGKDTKIPVYIRFCSKPSKFLQH